MKISATFMGRTLGYPPAMLAGDDFFFAHPAIETLFRLNEAGTVVPHLASGSQVASDLKSITITLNKGIKFHDGTEFNADAVKFNLDALRAINMPELKQVTSIDVVDPYAVRLNLSQYSNVLLYDFTRLPGMMPSPTGIKTNGVEWAKKNPVGTGAFKFKRTTPDVSVEYEKFDGYWQKGKPYLDGIEITYIKDPLTASAALQAGQIHMLRDSTSRSAKGAYDLQQAGFVIVPFQAAIVGLAADTKTPSSVFADKRLREAIEYAIDRESITKSLGFNFWVPLNQFAAPGNMAYNPNFKGRSYDPAKARQLLADAGYSKGLKTNLVVSYLIAKEPLLAVQANLAQVGIDATLAFPDSGKYNSQKLQEGWPNSYFNYLFGIDPNFLQSLQRQLPAQLVGIGTPPSWNDMMSKGLAATDFETLKTRTQEMIKFLSDEALVTPLWASPSYIAKSKNVHDDGQMKVHGHMWTPENAWISK